MTTLTMTRFASARPEDAAPSHGYEYRLAPPSAAPEYGDFGAAMSRFAGPLEACDLQALHQWRRALFSVRRLLASQY